MKPKIFDVLERMNTQHEGSVHAYFSNNIETVNAGSKGWGNIKMAITTGDAHQVMAGSVSGDVTMSVMLFIVDLAIMDQVKAEIEAMPEVAK